MTDFRNVALELVDNGMVSAEQMLAMALKYMSNDDVEDMLDCNELSERFEEDEDDGQPSWEQEWEDFGECYEQATRGLLGYVRYQAILDQNQTSSGPSGPVLTSEGPGVML